MTAQVDERVLRACHAAARRVTRIHRGAVEHDDILSAVYMWVATHGDKIEEWREEGRAGQGKLAKALYRAGQRFASRERHRINGIPLADAHWYTPGLVEELLADAWDLDDLGLVRRGPRTEPVRSAARLSEGNNYLAMIADVRYALAGLRQEDQDMLRARYAEGLTLSEVGARFNMGEATAARRIYSALERMVDRLGGEPPWWGERERPRRNSQAQAEAAL